MRWVCHTPSMGPRDHAPDFIHFHKKAACAKITNAKDLKHYRKEYDLTHTPRTATSSFVGPEDSPRFPPKALVPSDVIPGFTYGCKVRPSTPIHEVISNRFGERAEKDMQTFSANFEQQKVLQQSEVRRIPLTNASRGHARAAKKAAAAIEEQKEAFKISKFKRVTPKVDSNLHTPRPGSYRGNDLYASATASSVGEEPREYQTDPAADLGSVVGSFQGSLRSGAR